MADKDTKMSLKDKFYENHKLLKEIFQLIKENKKWWLLPIFLVFAVLSIFIVLAGGSSILPAIYSVF